MVRRRKSSRVKKTRNLCRTEAEDSDSDGSSCSGSSLCSDDTLYQLEKQRQKKKLDNSVLKQKETEEHWSSMQPKQQHRKLPTQNANSVIKQEPAKKKPAEGSPKAMMKKKEGSENLKSNVRLEKLRQK